MSVVVYDAILGTGLDLRQIMTGGYEANAEIREGRESAGLDPSEIYGGDADPVARFTTADLVGALAIGVANGLSIDDGITLPFRKAADQGTYLSGSNHPAISCTNGLAIVESFGANQGDDAATAEVAVHFRSTDGTDPVTASSGNALAASDFQAQYALGPVTVVVDTATSITPDIIGWTANTGITIVKERVGAFGFPVRINIRRRAPFIDLRFRSADDLEDFTGSFNNMVSATCYLRKLDDTGRFVADETAEHVKATFATGVTAVQSISASEANSGEATVRLWGKALTATATNAIT